MACDQTTNTYLGIITKEHGGGDVVDGGSESNDGAFEAEKAAIFALNDVTDASHAKHVVDDVISGDNGRCSGSEQPKVKTELGHSLVRPLVRSHRSLIRLLRPTCFARALRCTHSLAHSLPSSLESE